MSDHARRCPKCGNLARVTRPSEPDSGLVVPLLECREHGEFFEDLQGECHFVSEGAELGDAASVTPPTKGDSNG